MKPSCIKAIIAGSIFFAGLGLFLVSCGGGGGNKPTDTPTSGTVRVGIDDSYFLMMEAERFTFETVYKYATVVPSYKSEADVINDFMNDSVPLIIVSRMLTENQTQYLRERQFVPKVTKIAFDAVALIVNRENPDTGFYFSTVRDIFKGKITKWSQINPKSNLGNLKVVFDNFKSSNPRYFKEKFGLDSLPPTCFAANNNEEVIRYVETTKNAIGVIGVNWISDKADSVSNRFLQQVKVAGVAIEGDDIPSATFYKPYQAYIADGSYPFTREVFCINRQTYTGMAYGFSSFIAGEKGQLIILRSGMVPAAMPVRIVEIKN